MNQEFYRTFYWEYIVNLGNQLNPVYLCASSVDDDEGVFLSIVPKLSSWEKIENNEVVNSNFSNLLHLPKINQTTMLISQNENETLIDIIENSYLKEGLFYGDFHQISMEGESIEYSEPIFNSEISTYFEAFLISKNIILSSYVGELQIRQKLHKLGLPKLLLEYEKEMNIKIFT